MHWNKRTTLLIIAMTLVVLIALFFFFFTFSVQGPGQTKSKPGRPGPSSTALNQGKARYQNLCAGCHGRDLEGNMGPGLAGKEYTDEELYQALYEGDPANGMPAFASLGAEKIWQIVHYLQAQRQP